MTITKQPISPGTLFDSILSHREAFKKKPAEVEFPPIIDPDSFDTGHIPPVTSSIDTSNVITEAAPEKKFRSLIPQVPEKPVVAEEDKPYVYAGAKGKKRLDWEEVDYKEALPAEILAEERNRLAVEEAKAKAKRGAPRAELDQRSKQILQTIPAEIRPTNIVANFPHIMNLISKSWHEPKEFVKTLDELLMDDRGNRVGFPFAIIVELTDLREHYFSTVRPEARKLWDRL
jgi:hypothetical protein